MAKLAILAIEIERQRIEMAEIGLKLSNLFVIGLFSMDKRCWIGREMAILATLAIEMWTTPDKNGRNWVEIEEFVCYLPVWMGERRWKCHKIARIAKKGRFSTRFCSGLNLETPSKASLRLRLLLLLLRLLPLLLFLLSYFSFLHLANWKLVRIGGW